MAKTLTGIVTSDKRDKTITVTVTSRETHPIYKKQYTVNRKYQAHDPKNEAHLGDKVQISEIRPVLCLRLKPSSSRTLRRARSVRSN